MAGGGPAGAPEAAQAPAAGTSTTPADRLAATRPDHVWALDFQFDVTADGRVLKLLHVVDEFTRESLCDLVAHSIDADATVACLDRIVASGRTRPTFVRCDNGPELTANALRDWCRFSGAGTSYIEPGSPWQNPWVESYGSRIRDELLAIEQFDTLLEAQVLVADWRAEYNEYRPHSALGMLSPAAFSRQCGPTTTSSSHYGWTNDRGPARRPPEIREPAFFTEPRLVRLFFEPERALATSLRHAERGCLQEHSWWPRRQHGKPFIDDVDGPIAPTNRGETMDEIVDDADRRRATGLFQQLPQVPSLAASKVLVDVIVLSVEEEDGCAPLTQYGKGSQEVLAWFGIVLVIPYRWRDERHCGDVGDGANGSERGPGTEATPDEHRARESSLAKPGHGRSHRFEVGVVQLVAWGFGAGAVAHPQVVHAHGVVPLASQPPGEPRSNLIRAERRQCAAAPK